MSNTFYIGGTGRSGTTILKDCLSLHPSIASLPFEHRIFVEPDGLLDFYSKITTTQTPFQYTNSLNRLSNHLKSLRSDSTISRLLKSSLYKSKSARKYLTPPKYLGYELNKHIPGYSTFVDELLSSLNVNRYSGSWVGSIPWSLNPSISYVDYIPDIHDFFFSISKFFCQVEDSIRQSQDRRCLVDDNTWNLHFAPTLLEINNSAKFIHVYRNPLDVTASFMNQRWTPSNPLKAAKLCKSLLAQINSSLKVLDNSKVLSICLEDMVNQPSLIFDSICSFCDIDRELLDLSLFNLSSSSFERWKKDIPVHFHSDCSSILKLELNKFHSRGY